MRCYRVGMPYPRYNLTGCLLYVIRRRDTHEIKIGVSFEPKKRLRSIQAYHARPLELLVTVAAKRNAEEKAHKRFAAHRLSGEWFRECPEILEWVKELKSGQTREERRYDARRP